MQLERDPRSPDEKEEDEDERKRATPSSSQFRIIPAIEYTLQSRYENRTTYLENENVDLREPIALL